jgi:glutamate synthase domain-containing protein 3
VVQIDAQGLSIRDLNAELRRLAVAGEEVVVRHPAARHNLGVAVTDAAGFTFHGSVGYYCAGLNCGAEFEVTGNAGWGVAENMTSGRVIVRGDAGACAGASMRGGTLYVAGNTAARTGISMKGGTLIVGGNAGFMTGFMIQLGRIIVRGDVSEGVGDSMYEGEIYVGGRIKGFGNDAVLAELSPEDEEMLATELASVGLPVDREYCKIVAGKKLWYFDKKEHELWKRV